MKRVIVFFILFGIQASLFAQLPTPSKGRIVRHEQFASRFVKARNIDVWLPEAYSPERRYAVLYMHDGQNLFDSAITFNRQEWRVDETLDSLLQLKAISNCIVIGIWNTDRRRTEYFPGKVFEMLSRTLQDTLRSDLGDKSAQPESDQYLKFIVQELKPFIDKTYATKPGRNHTYISGSSMGGLISMYAICEYPEVFGGAACLSTHWPGSVFRKNQEIPNAFIAYMKQSLPSPKTHKFYFDYGTETLDSWYEPHQLKVDEVMLARKYGTKNWLTRKFPGATHSEIAWQKRFYIPMTFLFGTRS